MKKVNVLLVDDRPDGLVTLGAVLDHPEYNLVKAQSGREALAHLLEKDFAVILMDVQMPDMDGFETATIIKQREKSKNIPIIFMTANSKADHYVSIGYSVGAVDYVLKPFDPYVLKSKVGVFVDLYKKNILIREQAEALREGERREQMRVLRELENEGRRRYQNLADAIPQVVFRAKPDGAIEYFNQFWQRYTGYSQEQSVGFEWKKAIHPGDLEVIGECWETNQKNQAGFECESRIQQGSTGNYRWHLLRVVPEFGNLGELISWIGVATDIHDHKLTQQELLHAKRMADAASETKSNFLANMSHEIRTPLGIILGFSELLNDSTASPAEKLDAISVIRRNGEQLSKIIDEILDLSKVEAGKMDFEKADVSVVELVNGVKAFMTLPAKEKGLSLNFGVDGNIPSRISTSATRVQQILINLIGNGIKFSPRGKIDVSISYHKNSKSLLRFSVKDSGPGLTQAQIENLFQPFTQVDTSMTRKHGGTGLGLALSRKLARALGGDISVSESLPGEGCDFVFTLETGSLAGVAWVDSLEVAKPMPSMPLSKENNKLQGIKILLVEDSIDNQVLVSRFLSMAGAKVELANNGVEGVQKALSGHHDIVLMDIQMPELDGYGAISQLRGKGFKTPIIALTAHGMVEDRIRCLEMGSNDHLTKPINRQSLIERVQKQVFNPTSSEKISNVH